MEAEAAFSSEFPSVLVEEAIEPSPYQAALFHLQQGLQALCDLSPGKDRERRQAHEELLKLQRQVLQLLHVHFSPEREHSGAKRFADLLRQHREDAGLTQLQLAQFAGLSLSLIRKLEQGSTHPTRSALLALCSVAELKLLPSEATIHATVKEISHRHAPNWYIPPGFDSVAMMSELAQQMNSSGGTLEQTYAYLDHKSALDWIQLCNTPSYVAMCRESFPHRLLAERLREVVGQVGLDIIALGPGDGRSEVMLVQNILQKSDQANIRFYLFDASQPLLSRAFKHAADTFTDESGVFVCGIQGNFHQLPRYMQLHYTPARSHRRRVYVLVGNTIGNIEHEPQFFQNAFAGAAPGDILIFDADHAYTNTGDPADIWRVDPALQKPIPESHQRWLAGPIERYCKDVQSVTFDWRLDTDRPLPGSYGLQFIAKVGLPGMQHKTFCMFSIRRYDPSSMVRCLQKLDWSLTAQLPFLGATRPRSLFMFQKRLPR